jgi:hypothetical protein
MAKAKSGYALFNDNMRRKQLDEQYYQNCNVLKEVLSSQCTIRQLTEDERKKYQC